MWLPKEARAAVPTGLFPQTLKKDKRDKTGNPHPERSKTDTLSHPAL